MKKLTFLLASLCLVVGSLVFSTPAHAATVNVVAGSNGPNCNDGGYFKINNVAVTNIVINSGDSITFSVPANDPYAPGLEIHNIPGGDFTILPGGQPHPTGDLLVDVPNLSATWPSSGCQKGSGTITVKQPATPPPPSTPPTTPPPAPPPPAPIAPAPVPPPPPNKPPEAIKIDKVVLDGDKLNTTKPISVDVSKPITISGYTIANGVVNITIHSDVRNEIARANATGFWSLDISGLEPGNHTVDATVTDLSTHLTSASATILKFSVTGENAVAATKVLPKSTYVVAKKSANKTVQFILLAIVALGAACSGAYWFIKKRKMPQKPNNIPPATSPPPTEIAPTT
jgi:hypothetical protein